MEQRICHFSFKSTLSEKLNNSQWWSDVLLFLEFVNIVSILFYNFIEFIILLHTFLVFFFLDPKNKWFDRFHLVSFSDLLSDFPCATAISNLWSVCLEINTLTREDKSKERERLKTLATRVNLPGYFFACNNLYLV